MVYGSGQKETGVTVLIKEGGFKLWVLSKK